MKTTYQVEADSTTLIGTPIYIGPDWDKAVAEFEAAKACGRYFKVRLYTKTLTETMSWDRDKDKI